MIMLYAGRLKSDSTETSCMTAWTLINTAATPTDQKIIVPAEVR